MTCVLSVPAVTGVVGTLRAAVPAAIRYGHPARLMARALVTPVLCMTGVVGVIACHGVLLGSLASAAGCVRDRHC
ncbi:hypothetical protein [Miltoncostaea marina]|uniref:hypothetical protein n=1 Tax=Miltoncostaea marina TaxID=2843215 RepID=UPI001C3CACC1|nr:hypothetical protein [Miltoncostaea marina]